MTTTTTVISWRSWRVSWWFLLVLWCRGLKAYTSFSYSTRPVRIIRLVTKHTVEDIILKRANHKLQLTQAVIDEGHFNLQTGEKRETLAQMLKFGLNEALFGDVSQTHTEEELTALLGTTEEGAWSPIIEGPPPSGAGEGASHTLGSLSAENGQGTKDEPDSIYVYMGKDYKASVVNDSVDQQALDRLLAQTVAQTSRQHRLEEPQSKRRRVCLSLSLHLLAF